MVDNENAQTGGGASGMPRHTVADDIRRYGWVFNLDFTMAKDGEGPKDGERRDEVIPPYGQLVLPIMADGIRHND